MLLHVGSLLFIIFFFNEPTHVHSPADCQIVSMCVCLIHNNHQLLHYTDPAE